MSASGTIPRHMRPPPQFVHDWFSPLRSSEVVAGQVTPFTFLGHELVAFRDGAGQVVVLDAQCPHFGAHRGFGGRVVDGCLRCPFHGLHFDGNGVCVKGDYVREARSLSHVRSTPWTVHETAASIFIWHGAHRDRPDRPLPFARPDFFAGWSEPVTNAGRALRPTNIFFPSENVIDIQHFYAVHRWELQTIERYPSEDEDGSFRAVMKMRWRAGAQSRVALVRRLGRLYSSDFHFDIRILSPGMAVAISTLAPEQGSLQIMTIILMTPLSETDCAIRVVASVKRTIDTKLNAFVRRLLGAGIEEALSRIFLAVSTKDFDGDANIWTHRRFLSNPKPLPDDGPIVAYRKWGERFWPPDYLPDAAPAVAPASRPREAAAASART
jgi:phenylpropionate dioxygenase-like ring-hydroxylating dioxygenase large terminal subunit